MRAETDAVQQRSHMARIELDDVSDPEQVFIGGTLRMARRAEEWLRSAGVDYAVRVEPYGRSFLFGTARMGAVFYVASADAERCRQQLDAAGLGKGVIELRE
jgi:hypothetical protein